jgi:4-diphosphocytidyl-2-C-methyl-D-erythritol kinase
MKSPRRVAVEAPAKINLFLQVGPLREDGYHEVRTVMQSVDWCDRIEFDLLPRVEGFSFSIEGDFSSQLDPDDNLVTRTLQLFCRRTGSPTNRLHVRLVKRIPPAAGLGGGSSDAAASLMALNHLFGHPCKDAELEEMASELGSDVPFFLHGGTALAEGRGEKISPLSTSLSLFAVMANPGRPLSTRSVYQRFDELGKVDFSLASLQRFIQSLRKCDPKSLLKNLRNDLQDAAADLESEVTRLLKTCMKLRLARGVKTPEQGILVSGSGPTIFILEQDEQEAKNLALALLEHASWVRIARFKKGGPRILANAN